MFREKSSDLLGKNKVITFNLIDPTPSSRTLEVGNCGSLWGPCGQWLAPSAQFFKIRLSTGGTVFQL